MILPNSPSRKIHDKRKIILGLSQKIVNNPISYTRV